MGVVYLTGLPGAGKTSIGIALSALSERPFVDLDSEIERETHLTIPQIFASRGEQEFRDLETAMLMKVSADSDAIVSLGAGALERDENFQHVRHTGKLVYLKADLDVLIARLLTGSGRPLLEGAATVAEIRERLETLLSKRGEQYNSADIIYVISPVDSPSVCAKKLMAKIQNA